MTLNITSHAYEMALEEARRSLPNGDSVMRFLTEAHRIGDKRSTYALSVIFFNGQFNQKVNQKKAKNLLKMAAKSNVAEAVFDLAVHIDNNESEDGDEMEVYCLYMRAALLGHREACRQMSAFHLEGKIVPHDRLLASEWKLRAKSSDFPQDPPWRQNI